MANLKTLEVEENKTVTQTISMKGGIRNKLVQLAEDNGRSLAAEIMYRVKNDLKKEGII